MTRFGEMTFKMAILLALFLMDPAYSKVLCLVKTSSTVGLEQMLSTEAIWVIKSMEVKAMISSMERVAKTPFGVTKDRTLSKLDTDGTPFSEVQAVIRFIRLMVVTWFGLGNVKKTCLKRYTSMALEETPKIGQSLWISG